MTATRLVIRGAAVVTVDAEIGDLPRGDILVEDGSIVAVAPELPAMEAEVIDASGMIALPGFVDTHRHTWEAPLRGLLPDATVLDYLDVIHGTVAPVLEPGHVEIGNLVGAVDALSAGVTTLFDWCHACLTPDHADAAVQGLENAHIRSVFGYGMPRHYPGRPVSALPATEVERLKVERFSSDDQLLTLAIAAVGGPLGVADDVLLEDFALGRRLAVPISVHVDLGRPGSRSYGGVLTRLDELDLLGPDLICIHGCGCTDEKWRRVAETGGSLSIAPAIEMGMGMGVPPIGAARRAGVPLSLSIDVVTSTCGDMFNQMRIAFACGRMESSLDDRAPEEAPPPLSARDVLEWATLSGARAVGLDRRVGSITPGKGADLVLLDVDQPRSFPVHDPIAAVVQSCDVSNVDTVIVAGRVLKRRGQLIPELAGVHRRAAAVRDDLLERADGSLKGPTGKSARQ